MIGNDIVDLCVAKRESNWSRPRFLHKLFTPAEQAFIAAASDKNVAIWLLWSRKESAYKIIARLKQSRFFAPKKIENIHLKSTNSLHLGQVHFEAIRVHTKSKVTDQYIHTVAQLNLMQEQPIVDAFFIEKKDHLTQSQTTYQHLLRRYAKIAELPKKELTIQKDKNFVPHLYYKDEKLRTTISLAHHGNYGAYAIHFI